jgi:hypothetical protein
MQDAFVSCTPDPSAHIRSAQLVCTGSGKATHDGAVDLFLMSPLSESCDAMASYVFFWFISCDGKRHRGKRFLVLSSLLWVTLTVG